MNIQFIKNHFIISAGNDEEKDLLINLPAVRKVDKGYSFPATPVVAGNIVTAFPYMDFDAAPGFFRVKYNEFKAIQEAALLRDFATELPSKYDSFVYDVPYKTFPPYEHQTRATAFASSMDASGLWVKMGYGKSRAAIDVIARKECKRVLIICTKAGVENVWPGQFEQHATFKYHLEALSKGSVAKKLEQAMHGLAIAHRRDVPFICVVGHASSWREPFGDWAIKEAKFDMCVIDECHKLASPSSQFSKWAYHSSYYIKHRLGLSGTLVPDKPIDAFGVCRWLDPGIFGTSQEKFKDKYCVMDAMRAYLFRKLRNDNREEYVKRLFLNCFIPSVEIDLGLPELLPPVDYLFDLPADVMKFYKKFKDELIAEWEDGKSLEVPNALAKITKLQQIANGFFLTDGLIDSKIITQVHNSKMDILIDILDNLSEPVVIFHKFTHDSEDIISACKSVGRKYSRLSGSCNELKEWQSGKTDVMILQIKAGSESIDCSRSSIGIYYSQDFSVVTYEQSIARFYRPPQKKVCRILRIMARNTVDVDIVKARDNKRDAIQFIIEEGIRNADA